MSLDLSNLKLLDFIGDVDKRTGRVRISREALQLISQIANQAGAPKPYGIDVSMSWRADPATGVFPGPDPAGPWPTGLIADLAVVFYVKQDEVARMTIRGFLTTATGQVHASELSASGEALVADFITATSGDSVRVDVTHVESGSIASASFSAIDQSVAGSTPAIIDFGGGGGGGGGSK